jgi:hypothetical protein
MRVDVGGGGVGAERNLTVDLLDGEEGIVGDEAVVGAGIEPVGRFGADRIAVEAFRVEE